MNKNLKSIILFSVITAISAGTFFLMPIKAEDKENTEDLKPEDFNQEHYDRALKGEKKLVRVLLEKADLKGADLSCTDLTGAELEEANLEGADLSFANLLGADLDGANLKNANLTEAKLIGAELEEANLEGANLTNANFEGADLEGANLKGAKIDGAYFRGATLEYAIWVDGRVCAEESISVCR